jgi:hypothetical protein
MPLKPTALSRLPVCAANAIPLAASNLLDRQGRIDGLAKAFLVHPADHLGPGPLVAVKLRLAEELVGLVGPATPVAVEMCPFLPTPNDQAVAVGEVLDRSVGNRRARAEHQESKAGGRDGDRLLLRHIGHRLQVLLDAALLQVEESQPVAETGQLGQVVHCAALAKLSNPKPNPLAEPMPQESDRRNASSSVTLSTPSNRTANREIRWSFGSGAL